MSLSWGHEEMVSLPPQRGLWVTIDSANSVPGHLFSRPNIPSDSTIAQGHPWLDISVTMSLHNYGTPVWVWDFSTPGSENPQTTRSQDILLAELYICIPYLVNQPLGPENWAGLTLSL